MRLRSHVHVLATAATVVALSVPAADAAAIGDGGVAGPLTNPHVAAASHPPASTDWPLIALAGGGAAAVVAAGLGGSRRLNRRGASASQAPARRVA